MFRKFWKPLGLIILILFFLPFDLWSAPIGKISHLEGEADLTAPDGKIALVKVSDPVSVGDILRTKTKSKVEVSFFGGNSIFIAERSRLKITEYDNQEGRTSILDLFRGKVRVVLTNLARKSIVELHTPTAVTGVRGTIWISTHENGVSESYFESGVGYGYNKQMPDVVVTISAGHTMTVSAPDQPPVVRPAPDYELNKHHLDTTPTDSQDKTQSDTQSESSEPIASTQPQEQTQDIQTASTESVVTDSQPPDQSVETQPASSEPIVPASQPQEQAQDTQPVSTESITTFSEPQDQSQDIQTASTESVVTDSQPQDQLLIAQSSPIPSPDANLEAPPPPLPPPTLPSPEPLILPTAILPPPPPPIEVTTILPPEAPPSGIGLAGFTGTFDAPSAGGPFSLTGVFSTPPSGGDTTAISGTGYDGYLAGIAGSWEGLFDSIYNSGGTVGFLTGSLSDPSFDGINLNAAGTLVNTGSYATNGTYATFTDGPMLLFGDISPVPSVTDEFGSVSGYRTTVGGIVAVGTGSTTGGSYNPLGPTWTWQFGDYLQLPSANPYVFLGEVTGTDDGAGHITLESPTPIRYMDSAYSGTIDLSSRGVYTGTGASAYDSMGTARYILDPLAFSGPINTDFGYIDNTGAFISEGSMVGLMGGTVSFSTTPQSFLAMGTYSDMGHSIFGGTSFAMHDNVENTDASVRFFGIKYGTDPSAYGLMGRMLGIYIKPLGGTGYEAGYVWSGDATGLFYPEIGMWEAAGTIYGQQKTSFTNLTAPVVDYDTLFLRGTIVSESGSGTGIMRGRLGYVTSQAGNPALLPWGTFTASAVGTYAPGEASLMGGKYTTQTSTIGYFLRDLSAFNLAANGTFTATLSNEKSISFLGSTTLNNVEMFGTYQSGTQTYEGIILGRYDTTPFLYANRVYGDMYKQNTATLHYTGYERPMSSGNYSSPVKTDNYLTAYIIGGNAPKYGFQIESRDYYYYGGYISTTLYPSDTSIGYYSAPDTSVPRIWQNNNRTSAFVTPWRDLSTSPPTTYYGVSPYTILTNTWPVTSPITVGTNQYVKTVEGDWDINAMERILSATPDQFDLGFGGMMGVYQLSGGTNSLWTSNAVDPVGVTILGDHLDVDATIPVVFRSRRFYSQNYAVSGTSLSPTADGGAYMGLLSGTLSGDRSIDAAMYGLYMSPTVGGKWEAGFLKPTGTMTGTSYSGVNMWDADGGIYRVPFYTDASLYTTVDAAHLLDLVDPSATVSSLTNIIIAAMGYPDLMNKPLYGQFKDGAALSGEIKNLMSMDFGTSWSIKELTDFGVFELLHGGFGNTYSNPSGYTDFHMNMASIGQFGGKTAAYGTYTDFGLWAASIDGALSSPDKISGTLTGNFLTYTKQGALSGTFLGNIIPGTPTSGSWQGASVGGWEKTRDVSFSSGFSGFTYCLTKNFNGYDATSHYWVSDFLIGEPRDAEVVTNLAGPVVTSTDYDWEGPPDQSQYGKWVWLKDITDPANPVYTLQEATELTAGEYNSAIDAIIAGMPNKTEQYWINDEEGHDGIFAGFNDSYGNLWDHISQGRSTEIALMGEYSVINNLSIFGGTIASFNPLVDLNPYSSSVSPIGGAYYGYLGAAFGKQSIDADWIDGMINGLYYDPSGNVGILYGKFSGDNNPNIGAWTGTGTIDGGYVMGMAGSSLTEANFASNVSFYSSESSYRASDVVVTGDDVQMRALHRSSAMISNGLLNPPGSGSWGVWQNYGGGIYSGNPAAWSVEANGYSDGINMIDYYNVQLNATESNGIKTGDLAGATISSGITGVTGGTFKGLFDPVQFTYQAVVQGIIMDTATFVNKVSSMNDAQRQAFTDATKIPAFQVGQATLIQGVGAGPVNNLSNVTMNNVTFFSSSTGGDPQIWATGGVTGSFSGPPSTGGPSVPLSGGGLTATFSINNWDTTNNNWGAKVAGSGNLSGGTYIGTVDFKGAAAGTIVPAGGTFSGTGAGIAKPSTLGPQ